MSIQESNKLIAEFMGWTVLDPDDEYYAVKEGDVCRHPIDYHEDWIYLMPVFEKIQGLERGRFHFSIDPWSFMLVDYKEQEKEVFTYQFDADDPLIFRYYQSVIGFIEWYNSQPSNTTP